MSTSQKCPLCGGFGLVWPLAETNPCEPMPARIVPVEYWAGSELSEPQAHNFLGINYWTGDVLEAERAFTE